MSQGIASGLTNGCNNNPFNNESSPIVHALSSTLAVSYLPYSYRTFESNRSSTTIPVTAHEFYCCN
jgi:hypothetical protein